MKVNFALEIYILQINLNVIQSMQQSIGPFNLVKTLLFLYTLNTNSGQRVQKCQPHCMYCVLYWLLAFICLCQV